MATRISSKNHRFGTFAKSDLSLEWFINRCIIWILRLKLRCVSYNSTFPAIIGVFGVWAIFYTKKGGRSASVAAPASASTSLTLLTRKSNMPSVPSYSCAMSTCSRSTRWYSRVATPLIYRTSWSILCTAAHAASSSSIDYRHCTCICMASQCSSDPIPDASPTSPIYV